MADHPTKKQLNMVALVFIYGSDFVLFLVVFYWDMVRSDHLSYEVDLFKTRIKIMSA